MDRKKKILLVLFALLVVTVIYRYRHPFEQQKVTRLKYAPGQKKVAPRKSPRTRISMKNAAKYPALAYINLFVHPPRHSGSVIRNLFFDMEHVEKRPPVPPPAGPSGMPQHTMQVEDPVQKAMRELSKFRVFGSFESKGNIVLFIERGRDILVVRKGDWIDGRFQVKEINPNSITIWARDVGKTINVALDQ